MKVASANERRRLGFYLLLPGLICLGLAAYWTAKELRFRATALPAVGKYTDEGGSPTSNGGISFAYFITFQAQSGGSYQFMESGVDRQLEEGKPIPVLYDPADPKNARMAARNVWGLEFLLAPAGLLFTMLGAVLTRRPQKRLISVGEAPLPPH